MAYYGLEPFGEERADMRAAMLACLIANANRDEKKRREPFTAEDFMLKFGAAAPARKQTWEQQKAIFQQLSKGQAK